MKPSDRKLGMDRDITRRDFIHDLGLVSLGLNLPLTALAVTQGGGNQASYYPPTRTGLRGAHPGSFEVAHALARGGKDFGQPRMLDEQYDLVVVGGGLSGLSAAYFYRKLHGADSRILILDNHDDFGGHAKRNEFHQGGLMRLAWGGTVNMEYPLYSVTAMGLLEELGIDIPRLLQEDEFGWIQSKGLQGATWFDRETFGRDVLLPGVNLRSMTAAEMASRVGDFPISAGAREELLGFLNSEKDVLAGMPDSQKMAWLRSTSYRDFLRAHFAVSDEAFQVFSNTTSSFWGVRAQNLSVAECLESSLPGAHVLGGFWHAEDESEAQNAPSAMFPDGNSSIARLLVRSLIPASFPGMNAGSDPFSIVTETLDYSQIDQPSSSVRLRLNATAVHAENIPDGAGVAVSYVSEGEVLGVRSKHCVLACYNRIIPSLCPQLPEAQKAALHQCKKRPMLEMNVLLRNGQALQKSGISGAYLPGRLCQSVFLVTGVNVGEYRPAWRPEDVCVLQFYGAIGAPESEGMTIAQQNQAGRERLLGMSFEDYEREVRIVLDGVWGASGMNTADDILAITVNRWPHGYARDHIDLEDPAWNADPPPNVIGRRTFGNIAIANSDAGADAYTHAAIDQAWRAVHELPA